MSKMLHATSLCRLMVAVLLIVCVVVRWSLVLFTLLSVLSFPFLLLCCGVLFFFEFVDMPPLSAGGWVFLRILGLLALFPVGKLGGIVIIEIKVQVLFRFFHFQLYSVFTVFPSQLLEKILHMTLTVTGRGVVDFVDGDGKGEHVGYTCVQGFYEGMKAFDDPERDEHDAR